MADEIVIEASVSRFEATEHMRDWNLSLEFERPLSLDLSSALNQAFWSGRSTGIRFSFGAKIFTANGLITTITTDDRCDVSSMAMVGCTGSLKMTVAA